MASASSSYFRPVTPVQKPDSDRASTVSEASSISVDRVKDSVHFLKEHQSGRLSSDLFFHASVVAEADVDRATVLAAHTVLASFDSSVRNCRGSGNSTPDLSHISDALNVANLLSQLNDSKESRLAIRGATKILALTAKKMMESGDQSSEKYKLVMNALLELECVDAQFPADMSHELFRFLFLNNIESGEYAKVDLVQMDRLFAEVEASYLNSAIEELALLPNFKWFDTHALQKAYHRYIRSEVQTMMRQQVSKKLVSKDRLLNPATSESEMRQLITRFHKGSFTRYNLSFLMQYLKLKNEVEAEIKART